MMPEPLSAESLADALTRLDHWSGDTRGIQRHLTFEDFRGAMQFMHACVAGIERLNHHPIWTNKFNVVDIHLDTFDVGHLVTSLDIELAEYMDRVLRERGDEFGFVEDA